MATKTPNQETTDDDELLYAEDEKGARIPDEDVLSAGTRPQILEFKAGGQKHKCEILMSQVTLETRQAPDARFRKALLELGLTGAEDVETDPDAAQLVEEIERLANLDAERFRLRAAIAIEALTRDSKGRIRISIPQFREGLTPEKLANDEIFGRRVINEIGAAVNGFFTG